MYPARELPPRTGPCRFRRSRAANPLPSHGLQRQGGVTVKTRAIVVGVAVKARFPQPGPRKTNNKATPPETLGWASLPPVPSFFY